MGADLLLAVVAKRRNSKPDWQAGKDLIEVISTTEDLLADLDISGMYIEDLGSDEDTTNYIRDQLDLALETFRESYEKGDRSVADLFFGEWIITICGGTSWGDVPSECFDAINFLEAAGVMKAMGFGWPEEPQSTSSSEW